jgi:hypothetical protein
LAPHPRPKALVEATDRRGIHERGTDGLIARRNPAQKGTTICDY